MLRSEIVFYRLDIILFKSYAIELSQGTLSVFRDVNDKGYTNCIDTLT